LPCPREVCRQAQHAVRVVTGQIGADEGIGDDLGCTSLSSHSDKKIVSKTSQIRGANVRHVASIE
jgi:hypothetical protein